jgi:hypothetical protein
MKLENLFVTMVVSLLIGVIGANSAAAVVQPCSKFTLDGDMSDWGLDLTQDWTQEATWLPNTGVYFIVEDNRDPTYGGVTGVHIKGAGSSYSNYDEPLIQHKDGFWAAEPYGGERYDMEALYMNQDDNCIYLALVTSVDPNAVGDDNRPGDLAMNLDRDKTTGEEGYEYGVKLGNNWLNQFDLYSMPDWEPSVYFPEVKPTIFKSGSSFLGSMSGVYSNTGINDQGYTNYVVELAIPKSMVGDPGVVSIYDFWIADQCGNDYIPANEFFFVLMGPGIVGLVLVFAYRSAKRKN